MSSEVRFEPSTLCNYSCEICPREKLTRKQENMDLNMFERLLDKCGNYRVCTFSGFGEPLMNPNLPLMIEYAKNEGFRTVLFTNGSMMKPVTFDSLRFYGLDSVRFSVYREQYRAVYENLWYACENKKGMQVHLISDITTAWKDFDLDSLEVWEPHNWVTGRAYRHNTELMHRTCGRPFRGPLQIQVDGTVNVCCFDFNGELTLGDLRTQDIGEIFQGERFKEIARAHRSGDFGDLICGVCDQRNTDKEKHLIYTSGEKINREYRLSTTGEMI